MPWTTDQVEKHRKGLDDKGKAQWVAVANSVYDKCIKDGGDDKSCAPKAIQQANGVTTNDEDIGFYKEPASNYEIRYEMYKGKEQMVVPIIMMTSGVHAGSHGPLLHLGEDLGKFPASWDGIPISIQHPQENGNNVSANQPHIIDKQVVGQVFNTHMDEGKLKAEAWIDQDMIQRISPEALKYIQEGKPLDVSVGVFTEDEYSTGEHNGEHYEGIAKNHRPDHLALLPGGRGACSWTDGCGIRANAAEDIQVDGGGGSGNFGHSGRKGAVGGSGGGGGGSKIADLIEKYKATGRVAFHHPRRKEISVDGRTMSESDAIKKMEFVISKIKANQEEDQVQTNMEMLQENLTEEFIKDLVQEGFSISINQISYQDISEKIQAKLAELDNNKTFSYVKEVFDKYFVYHQCPRDGQVGLGLGPRDGTGPGSGFGKENLFKQDYTVTKDDEIEFTGAAQPVVKKVEYITQEEQGDSIMANKDDKNPCCAEKVELLIQSEDTQFTEADREWLLDMDEGQIEKLETLANPANKAKADKLMADAKAMMDEAKALMANSATSKEDAIKVLKEELGDQTKFLGLLPPETRATMEHGLRLYKAEREKKISHILANTNAEVYTAEKLNAMSDESLDDLARAIKAPASYAPMSPQRPTNNEEILPPAGVVLDG